MTVGFLAEKQKNVRTTQGRVALPILYHDASVFQAFFSVDGAKAAAMLGGTGLKPMRMAGKALAGLVFFEYRKTSIGSYNEVGLALACYLDSASEQPSLGRDFRRPPVHREIGFYVVDLPVSTEIACVAGREIWGFPKFVTALPMEFGKGRFKGGVEHPTAKSPICRLEGKYPLGPKLPGIDMVLYSNHQGETLKTVISTKASMQTAYGRGLRLQVGNSKHRMAKNLRALGLDGARPFLIQVSGLCQSSLPAGVAVR